MRSKSNQAFKIEYYGKKEMKISEPQLAYSPVFILK